MDTEATIQTPLYWVQPRAMHRSFELHSQDGKNVGSLRFEKALGTSARGDSLHGAWTFKRVGFLSTRVTVRKDGSDDDIAVFHPKTLGGGFVQAFGRTLEWKQANFWGTQWSFLESDDTPLVLFKPGAETEGISNLFKTQSIVELTTKPKDPAELSLLILLGWYLIVMTKEDSSGADVALLAATM